jgi:hypothetical protein
VDKKRRGEENRLRNIDTRCARRRGAAGTDAEAANLKEMTMDTRRTSHSVLFAIGGLMVAAVLVANAPAQILDQAQTQYPYSFNGDATWAIWQQGITAGIAGQLAGIEVYVYEEGDPPLGSAEVYINAGPPWQDDDPDFWTICEPAEAGWQYIDVISADLHFEVDDVFVIGINGIDNGFWFGGSSPSPGGPYDGGELWFEFEVYQDGQYDMAFRTWVLVECPADFDGDGDVDTADLLFLLGCWGQSCGDVDGDGDTDTADLLALLAAWGECP